MRRKKLMFTVDIESDTQPGIIAGLEAAIRRLRQGGTALNVAASAYEVFLRPQDEDTTAEFQRQYADAHPKALGDWL